MSIEEITNMPAAIGAACIEESFRQYWKNTIIPVEITTTWAGDLYIALYAQKFMNDKNAISKTISDAVKIWKKNFEYLSQLIMATNYMAWICYESNTYGEFTQLFSTEYYKLLDVADKHLSIEEQSKLFAILN